MNFYRTLPVFPFEPSWSQAPVTRFVYELGAEQIGFGRISLDPEQNHLAQGIAFTLPLTSIAELRMLEGFVQRVRGRLTGFWLPGAAWEYTAKGGYADALIIQNAGLSTTWDLHPSCHLWLIPPNDDREAAVAVQIISVLELDPETEILGLNQSLPPDFSADWTIRRLHFVRLEKDTLQFEQTSPVFAEVEIRCYELPLEYLQAELGDQPVHLYTFTEQAIAGTQGVWRFTSHDVPVTYNGNTWTPAPISHGQLVDSLRGDKDSMELTSFDFPDSPLRVFLPFAPQRRLWLQVQEVRLNDGVGRIVFDGEVRRVEAEGRKLKATVATRLDVADRQFPRLVIGRTCSAQLGDASCTVNMNSFSVTGAIAFMDGNQLTLPVAAGIPDNWFAGGHCVLVGGATGREVREITASSGIVLSLNAPFSAAYPGDTVHAYAGCDRRPTTCKAKFFNYVNFQGHPNINRNLALKAVQPAKTQASGKK